MILMLEGNRVDDNESIGTDNADDEDEDADNEDLILK